MDYNSSHIDQHWQEVYQKAIYKVFLPPMSLKIGELNEALNVFCFDNNVYHWAFVSAANPGSEPLSTEENEQRHQKLILAVQNMGLRYCEGIGTDPAEKWPAEKSLFILDIRPEQALTLANKFEQRAIVIGEFNKAPELLFC